MTNSVCDNYGLNRRVYKIKMCNDHSHNYPSEQHCKIKTSKIDKRFKCSHTGCTYSAKTNYEVSRHFISKHTTELTIECPHKNCDYKTKTKVSLAKHIKRIHSNAEKKRKMSI